MMRRVTVWVNPPRVSSFVVAAAMVVVSSLTSDAYAQASGVSRPATSTPRTTTPRATTARSATKTPPKPTANYWVYVGAESADLIHRIRFGPVGAVVERTLGAGELPAENEGPHGLQISADGKYLHMTTGHGTPDGKYWKYELGPDTLVGEPIFLGNFPASIDVTPDGLYAFAVNFNLHGEMVPSSVSVIYTPTNTEVARPTTCTMPHGSRVSADGMRQYSTCMMDDQLVEVDTRTFKVARRFSVAKGNERPIPPGEYEAMMKEMLPEDSTGGSPHKHEMPPATCSPTWAQPSATGNKVYVACNKSDEILEIDAGTWSVSRRFPTGRAPYNLAVTPDGKLLVATLKAGNGVQVFDLVTGKSVMQDRTSITLAHGVTVSPDSRYAFVSVEGKGAQPGKVDVFDLSARAKVATVDVGQQASGIAFWRTAPVKR
ncbi:MAG TPA: YncE family protein [Gemmatimonadaceae bacterium]|nr:YncE family protein [Gemmatimonadaceae bacterium]